MAQVVQARCPHCKNMLRIPAEWLAGPMKCKHCRQIFQAKPRAGEGAVVVPARVTRRNRGMWQGALVIALVLSCVGGVLIFAVPQLTALMGGNKTEEVSKKSAVETKKDKANLDGETKPDAMTDRDDNPKLKTDTKTEAKTGGLSPNKSGPFPRRALLINVSNYLLFNPLHYGTARAGKYPGSSTAVLADTINRPPLSVPATQITELADAGKTAFSTAKAVIENTITDFVDTARAQDRVIVLFTGHAIEIEKEAYLVPVEGNREDAKTLLPLSWVYDKLAGCKARQKLLILDVFRYPPARGEELPGTGAMSDDFDAKLLKPPAGVQVWASCIKGQQSIELDGGSVFMQALCTVLQERLPGIQAASNRLPVEAMVPKVNQRLKEILAPQKLEQLSRLSGTHTEEGGVPYNADEPLPPKLVLKASAPAGAKIAGQATIKSILGEINRLPPVRVSQKQVQAASLPGFSAKVLEDYQADYKNWPELVEMAKDKEKYPLRAAVLEAIRVLQASEKITLRETLTNPGGGVITPQIKSQFAATQKEPGIMIFHMETALADLKAAGELRAKEPSKRWLANYDYALARLMSRLVYIYEYNNILAQVRADSLPPLEPIHHGWRVGSQKKVQINEPKVKDLVKNISKTWKRIAEENPGTPWAVLAARENMTALGLVWRASRD
ncbi:MAG TPA: caspase family protein [Gemmataceae bacterium]|nr:caspase family protein [Gemmataceae bacterium]